jgi:hypothetical protein
MRRALRFLRVLVDQTLRARTLAALGVFAGLSAAMLLLARGTAQYGESLALNLAAEFLGAFVILFALTPIVRRAQHGGVREHRRLDFEWYTDRVVGARMRVRVMHTFSRLFAPPFDRRFLRAAHGLLRRQGRVQILLLDPDSVAAAQRTAELRGHGDVSLETRRNLRVLDGFRHGLDDVLRQRFEVRLYSVSPSVQIYQWDNRLLASFLPVGQLSGDSAQLELSVESPLGVFVMERFDELWRQAKSIEDYLTLRLTIKDGSAGARDYRARFVTADGRYYVADHQVMAHLARCRDRHVEARLAAEPDRTYTVDVVAEESEQASAARAMFAEKYDRPEPAFVRLAPR